MPTKEGSTRQKPNTGTPESRNLLPKVRQRPSSSLYHVGRARGFARLRGPVLCSWRPPGGSTEGGHPAGFRPSPQPFPPPTVPVPRLPQAPVPSPLRRFFLALRVCLPWSLGAASWVDLNPNRSPVLGDPLQRAGPRGRLSTHSRHSSDGLCGDGGRQGGLGERGDAGPPGQPVSLSRVSSRRGRTARPRLQRGADSERLRDCPASHSHGVVEAGFEPTPTPQVLGKPLVWRACPLPNPF